MAQHRRSLWFLLSSVATLAAGHLTKPSVCWWRSVRCRLICFMLWPITVRLCRRRAGGAQDWSRTCPCVPPESRPGRSPAGAATARGLRRPASSVSSTGTRPSAPSGTWTETALAPRPTVRMRVAGPDEPSRRSMASRSPSRTTSMSRGLPCTAGLAAFRDRIAEQDAPMVASARAAGLVIVGKTAMDEARSAPPDRLRLSPCENPLRPASRRRLLLRLGRRRCGRLSAPWLSHATLWVRCASLPPAAVCWAQADRGPDPAHGCPAAVGDAGLASACWR